MMLSMCLFQRSTYVMNMHVHFKATISNFSNFIVRRVKSVCLKLLDAIQNRNQ